MCLGKLGLHDHRDYCQWMATDKRQNDSNNSGWWQPIASAYVSAHGWTNSLCDELRHDGDHQCSKCMHSPIHVRKVLRPVFRFPSLNPGMGGDWGVRPLSNQNILLLAHVRLTGVGSDINKRYACAFHCAPLFPLTAPCEVKSLDRAGDCYSHFFS